MAKRLKIILFLFIVCLITTGVFYFSHGWKDERVQTLLNSEEQSIVSAQTPLDPKQFNLPETAKEVVGKRTENVATFEISPGKYAAVSGINAKPIAKEKPCNSRFPGLCQLNLWRQKLISAVFAAQTAATSPGTMVNIDGIGTNVWSNVDSAKTSNNSYSECPMMNFEP